jgi:hypothetical protein
VLFGWRQVTAELNGVTRLDEFSPFGRLFTLESFPNMMRRNPNFGLLFSTVKLSINFDESVRWARFWAIFFSKTHLVALKLKDFPGDEKMKRDFFFLGRSNF